MTETIRFTITPGVRAVHELKIWEYPTFDKLIEAIPSVSVESKESVDLMLCVAEWHEMHRTNTNVKTFGRLFMADFDRLGERQAESIFAKAAEIGVSAYLYTTFSHLRKGQCFRLLIELDREYPAEHHLAVWDGVNRIFLGLVDPKTRVPQIPFYLPAYPVGDENHVEHRFEGIPLCVDSLLENGASPPPRASQSKPAEVDYSRNDVVDTKTVTLALESWARYRGGNPDRIEKAAIARDAKRIVQGKPPKDIEPGKGQRHGFMVSLAGYLALQFPRADPAQLCEHFRTVGWDQFADGDHQDHGIDRLVGMVDDFQRAELEKLAALEEERKREQREAILRATGGERDHLVTEDETATLEKKYGPEWPQLAVLQHQSAHWFLRPDGSYSIKMWRKEEVLLAARDQFAVFGDHVSLWYEDPRTEELRRHNYDSFRNIHATALMDVCYDQTIAETVYDPLRQTLSLACAAPRVKPFFHADVQEWLERSGGDLLVDMTAGMSRLSEMLPALVLTGDPGCGKTLYANGVGRIYGQAPNEAMDSHVRFNADQAIRQPITLHDEKAGEAYEREGTSLVRKYTTQGERWIEAKFMPKVLLKGFPRLIFCANSAHILDTREDMTAPDRAAFAERLVHVAFPDDAKAYCEKHIERTQKEWIGKDHLAEHFLWLGQNWEIKNKGERFIVKGPRTKLHEGLAGGAGVAAEVIQWLLSFIANPKKVEATGDAPLELNPEKNYLRVTASAILRNWEQYLTTRPPDQTSKVQNALNSISLPSRQYIRAPIGQGKTRRVKSYEIDQEVLLANLDRHHLTEEDFHQALGRKGV